MADGELELRRSSDDEGGLVAIVEGSGGAGGGGMDLGTLGPGGERADGLGVYSLRSGSGKG
jgi:hypothetical protein